MVNINRESVKSASSMRTAISKGFKDTIVCVDAKTFAPVSIYMFSFPLLEACAVIYVQMNSFEIRNYFSITLIGCFWSICIQ